MPTIVCDCTSCRSINVSAWLIDEDMYWRSRRNNPHLYDDSCRPLTRDRLQEGDCFEYLGHGYRGTPIIVASVQPHNLPVGWLYSYPIYPRGARDEPVRMIPHGDPRRVWLDTPGYCATPPPEPDYSAEAVW
jgi:hypothetical protein